MSEFPNFDALKRLRASMSDEEWSRFVDECLARLNDDLMEHGVSEPSMGLAATVRRKP